MILVRYSSDGMKMVVEESITQKEFNALFKKREAEMENDDELYVSRLSKTSFEVTHDSRAAGYQYVLRPDNWPRKHGEPL